MNQTIQHILGAFLSAQGQHELARQAFESDNRLDWVRLGDEAIRSAPEYNRTHVAHVVKLALDSPDCGGPNLADDFELRKENDPLTTLPVYRAYRLRPGVLPEYMGLASREIDKLERRVVGMYVARNITKTEQI